MSCSVSPFSWYESLIISMYIFPAFSGAFFSFYFYKRFQRTLRTNNDLLLIGEDRTKHLNEEKKITTELKYKVFSAEGLAEAYKRSLSEVTIENKILIEKLAKKK